MRFFPALLFLLVGFLQPLRAQNPSEAFEARTYTGADGNVLPYRLLKPKDYSPAQKYPLVLFMHGAGERGTDNGAQLRNGVALFANDEVRTKYPAFILAPQVAPDRRWAEIDWGSDNPKQPEQPSVPMTLTLEVIAQLQKEFSIDPDRLYVNGLSMGGYGTWDAITRYPQMWAAAVPICGGGDKAVAAKAKDIPIWDFHGMVDQVVKPQRSIEMVDAVTAAGGHPLFSFYPYIGHNSWDLTYQEPELLPWLFAQKRGQPEVPFAKIAEPFAQPPSNQYPGVGPVQSAIWFRSLWRNHRQIWAERTLADQGAVVFFGDSITENWGSLGHDFEGLKVTDRGIGGDTSRGLLGRLDGDVLALHPKAVEIMIGTNDLDQGGEPEQTLSNVKEIVARMHKAEPQMPIVISKVMPRGPKAGFYPDKIKVLNGLYDVAFKDDPLVTLCDTWTLFNNGMDTVNASEFPDLLHPNAAGYAKWAEALKPIFAKLKL